MRIHQLSKSPRALTPPASAPVSLPLIKSVFKMSFLPIGLCMFTFRYISLSKPSILVNFVTFIVDDLVSKRGQVLQLKVVLKSAQLIRRSPRLNPLTKIQIILLDFT